jgi:hypothetical protein
MPPAGRRHQPPGGHGTERTGDRHQLEPADPPDPVEEQLRTPVLVEPRPAGGRPGERVAAEDRTLLDHELARLDVMRKVDRARVAASCITPMAPSTTTTHSRHTAAAGSATERSGRRPPRAPHEARPGAAENLTSQTAATGPLGCPLGLARA